MRTFFDRLGAIFMGLFLLIVIEGVATLGIAFKFEEYGPIAWAMQCMAVYLTCWAAVRMQESNS